MIPRFGDFQNNKKYFPSKFILNNKIGESVLFHGGSANLESGKQYVITPKPSLNESPEYSLVGIGIHQVYLKDENNKVHLIKGNCNAIREMFEDIVQVPILKEEQVKPELQTQIIKK